MEYLWSVRKASVRDAREHFGTAVAYTTLMTTLDRLFKKRLLTRRKNGRAFVYSAAASREEFEIAISAEVVDGLLDSHDHGSLPLLSHLIEAVGDRDRQLLDDLARMIREKQQELMGGRKP
jgi:predicted transcriptional regulator